MKWQHIHFDCLDSTNKTAWDYEPGTVITANLQQRGRGRYGRAWESYLGNLFMSFVLPDLGRIDQYISFMTAVALADALDAFDVRIKWPNDILLNQGKVAGILLEKTDKNYMVVGIGVNVVQAPIDGMLYQTASLNGKISADRLRDKIIQSFDKWLTILRTDGFSVIRERWLEKAQGIGLPVQVRLPNETKTGIFKEISPQGELVLETPAKTVQYITAGDVFFIG